MISKITDFLSFYSDVKCYNHIKERISDVNEYNAVGNLYEWNNSHLFRFANNCLVKSALTIEVTQGWCLLTKVVIRNRAKKKTGHKNMKKSYY